MLAKGTIQSDQRSAQDILLDHISLLGLEYSTPTPGNGDCFFEAISDQLERLGKQKQSAHDLRRNVVSFCRQNPTIQVIMFTAYFLSKIPTIHTFSNIKRKTVRITPTFNLEGHRDSDAIDGFWRPLKGR